MIEPRRLHEESNSDLERALLNAGATYRCSSSARMKTMAALGLAGSAALSAGAIGVSTTTLLAKWGWPKLLLTVTAIGAVTAVPLAYYVWHWHNAHPADAVVPAIVAKSNGPTHAALQSDNSQLPVPTQPAVAAAEVGTDVKSTPAPRVEPKSETPTSALSEELNALDGVRSVLAQGDANGALSRLDSYNKSFPRGRLQPEAEVLRIDALMKSGQADLAKKHAQAFLSKHPNSVLASRVKGLL